MNILFDLDGTLLPITNSNFENFYYPAISSHLNKYGYDPKACLYALKKGLKAMYEDKENLSNYDKFVEVFLANSNFQHSEFDKLFNQFYGKDFYNLEKYLPAKNYSSSLINKLKNHNLILATNPLFPKRAQQTRIELAGLDENSFSYITMMENSHYLKPNPLYFQEILEKNNLKSNEVIMIGNDYQEDYLPCKKLGIRCILIKDFIMNHEGVDLSELELYSFKELESNLENILISKK